MRQNVTFEEIVNAAESIVSKGDNPTIEKIRISIGSRGSNSTISKYLNSWRKHTTHKECYVNHIKPSNENIIDFTQKSDSEVINLRKELHVLKEQYETSQKECIIARSELNLLRKYQTELQNEKNQYIADLKQAHKISFEVLAEHYRNDLDKIEKKVNSLLSKIVNILTNINENGKLLS